MLSTKNKLQIAKIVFGVTTLLRTAFGLKNKGIFTRRGIKWELDLAQGIDFAIFLQGAFEPETVSFYSKVIKPGDCVIDIGANIGAHTLHFAKLVGPSGKVIAFEPTDYAFNKLIRNIELNPDLQKQIIAQQVLLDCGEGLKPNSIPSSWELNENVNSQKHAIHMGTYNSIEAADVKALDNAMNQLGNPKVQIIKLDVDGYELQVIKGAQSTLQRNKPKIIMEIVPYIYGEHGYKLENLLHLLKDFQILDFKNQKAKLNKIAHGSSINVFLKPKHEKY